MFKARLCSFEKKGRKKGRQKKEKEQKISTAFKI